jgi:hypothetical protein
MKKRLHNGETVEFQNDDHIMSVYYLKTWDGTMSYLVMFNGRAIKSAKTFPPIERTVSERVTQYNLIETNA